MGFHGDLNPVVTSNQACNLCKATEKIAWLSRLDTNSVLRIPYKTEWEECHTNNCNILATIRQYLHSNVLSRGSTINLQCIFIKVETYCHSSCNQR